MKLRSVLNFNFLGIVFLVTAFLTSIVQVVRVSLTSGEGPLAGGRKVIRIAHWQLEPGYREAMDEMIEKYNNLPHVKAAQVEVRQVPVTEKAYAQWLNVQLMSGTAPDICERGMARMASGSDYTARFFEPLGELVAQPNPYNAALYLPDHLPADLKKFLSERPWSETFIDGMQGGWVEDLQNYYAVPTSSWGAIRLFCNQEMIQRAKGVTNAALNAQPQPQWLAQFIADGYVTDTPELRAWTADARMPDTMGRLLLVCQAVRQLALQTGNDKLVPIAGSRYSQGMFMSRYLVPFTSAYARKLDLNLDSNVDDVETLAGYASGEWSFQDARMRAYFDCLGAICREFPPGFLALERDQANNRFVLGNAAMIASGGWDASSIFRGAAARSNPTERFTVVVIDFPLPGPGEKWHQFISDRGNEAQATAGAPYQVDQRSPHKQWAIDFLQYFSSFAPNERFNQVAGWIPAVVGASPEPQMQPFSPNPEGLMGGDRINFVLGGNISTIFQGQLWLYMSGDGDYDSFVRQVAQAIADPRYGADRCWFDRWQRASDYHRNRERTLGVEAARQLLLNEPDAADKYRRSLLLSVSENGGNTLRATWHELYPDRPFPEF